MEIPVFCPKCGIRVLGFDHTCDECRRRATRDEMRALKRRIAELEAELARVADANASLGTDRYHMRERAKKLEAEVRRWKREARVFRNIASRECVDEIDQLHNMREYFGKIRHNARAQEKRVAEMEKKAHDADAVCRAANQQLREAESAWKAERKNYRERIAELELQREFPWRRHPLSAWSIVGMNHYHVDGQRRLFVAMTKDGECIKAEGPDDGRVWVRLGEMAKSGADAAG